MTSQSIINDIFFHQLFVNDMFFFVFLCLYLLFTHDLSSFILDLVSACGYPGSPAHASIAFSSEVIHPGTVATYTCDSGFELLGPARRVCAANGTWIPLGIPFCGEHLSSSFICCFQKSSVNDVRH